MRTVASRDSRLSFRATRKQKAIIERGASAAGQNVTDFVVSSAFERAEQVLADQTNFTLSPAKWAAFVDALDRPVKRHQRLARLMSEPSILER